jgi:hypothetical protein
MALKAVGLKLTAVQLFPEMLAQRRLANLKLSSYLGLGDAKSRSTLDKRALGIGRLIFGGVAALSAATRCTTALP